MIDREYTEIHSQGSWTANKVAELAEEQVRGRYQREVLEGDARLSGANLKGKARKYAGHYRRSVENLLRRIEEAGVEVSERRGENGKRILVLGTPRG